MERITALIEPTIKAMAYELLGVEFATDNSQAVLRIYIDSADGVKIADCQQISRQISALLDVEDPIEGSYSLEVSSPGIERPLFKAQDYVRFAGSVAHIQLTQMMSGRKNFKGRLQGMDQNEVLIEVDGEQWRLPFAQIRKANLAPEN